MPIYADVDTALSEVPVNSVPLTDDTDFKSTEEAIAYNAAGMDLEWHFFTTGGAYTVTAVTPTTAGDYDWAHQGNGMYTIEIPASGGASINNDTEGHGYFVGKVTGVLPFRGPTIIFRASGINDLLIDSAYSATRGLAGTALPAAAADAAGGLVISDAGGFDIDNRCPSATSIGNMNIVFTTDFATNYSTANDQWNVSTSAVASVTGAVGSVTGAVGSVTGAVGSVTGNVGGNVTGSVGSISGVTFPTNFADLSITATDGRIDVGSWLGTAVTTSATSGKPEVDVFSVSDDTAAANNAEAFFDGTGYAGTNNVIPAVTTVTTTTNLTNAPTSGDLTATMKASVNAEVDSAIETYHLDHLLAVDYDPASKPGTATALLNEIIENDAGVSRFTANALEQAPSGSGADAMLLASGTIGATGNDTTHLHLDGLNYGDDEINDCLLVVVDNSASLTYSTWVTDWATTGDLATVETLPFTPEASTDTYKLYAVRRDMGLKTGAITAAVVATDAIDADALAADAIAEINATVDTALADYDAVVPGDLPANFADLAITASTGLVTVGTIVADAINAAAIADGAIDAATFAADVDAEILSYIVDDATRIDASVLNTAATAVGSDGSGLTEAGGTGDHLSAVPDTSGTTTLLSRLSATRAGYLDNLSAGAVATATKLLNYFRLLVRKDSEVATDLSTELGELNANTGTGTGAYDNTTESQESLRDRGDAAWITATGFSTFNAGSDTVTVGALNTGAKAEVNAEVDTALGDYDAPTNTEMVAAFTQIKGATWSSSTDTLEAIRDRGDAAWLTATGFSTHSAADVWTNGTRTLTAATNITSDGAAINATSGTVDRVTLTDTTTTNTDMRGTDSAFLAANAPATLYHAEIQFTRDQSNTQDEWTVTWFKDGVRQTTGITSPTIQVVKRADGTDLVASSAMTQIGSTGSYKYDEGTNRITVGEAVLAIAGATIDGSGRSFSALVGRDSS